MYKKRMNHKEIKKMVFCSVPSGTLLVVAGS